MVHTKKKIVIRTNPKKMSLAKAKEEGDIYDKDFFKWTRNQARHLKRKEFSKLDIDNLIEEIDSLGRSEKRTLKSHLEILLMQMLRVKFQPKKHTRSWDLSIKDAKHKTQITLQENPSLKPKLKEIVEDAYFSARIRAALDTQLAEDVFPEKLPWSIKEIFPDIEKKYR